MVLAEKQLLHYIFNRAQARVCRSCFAQHGTRQGKAGMVVLMKECRLACKSSMAHQRYIKAHEIGPATLLDCSLENCQVLLKCFPLLLGLLGANCPLTVCTYA